jgi:hypothetical protein
MRPVQSVGHAVHSGASEAREFDTLFFMLGWDRYGFDKKRAMTHYTELVFFCIRWDLRVMWCILVHPELETMTYYFSCSGGTSTDLKKRNVTRYAEPVFLHLVGYAGRVVHSGAFVA